MQKKKEFWVERPFQIGAVLFQYIIVIYLVGVAVCLHYDGCTYQIDWPNTWIGNMVGALLAFGELIMTRSWEILTRRKLWMIMIGVKRVIIKMIFSLLMLALPTIFPSIRIWVKDWKERFKDRYRKKKEQWEAVSFRLKWMLIVFIVCTGIGTGILIFILPLPKKVPRWAIRLLQTVANEEKATTIIGETFFGKLLKKFKKNVEKKVTWPIRVLKYLMLRGIRKRGWHRREQSQPKPQ